MTATRVGTYLHPSTSKKISQQIYDNIRTLFAEGWGAAAPIYPSCGGATVWLTASVWWQFPGGNKGRLSDLSHAIFCTRTVHIYHMHTYRSSFICIMVHFIYLCFVVVVVGLSVLVQLTY